MMVKEPWWAILEHDVHGYQVSDPQSTRSGKRIWGFSTKTSRGSHCPHILQYAQHQHRSGLGGTSTTPFRMTHHHSSKLFQDWRIFQHQMTLVSKSTLLQHHYGTSLLPAGPRIRYRRGGARDAVIDGRFHPASASRATTQQHYRISKFIRQDGVLSV